jgi:hypothetical protein
MLFIIMVCLTMGLACAGTRRTDIGARRGGSKQGEDRHALWYILGVARLQGGEELSKASPGKTLGNPWPPLAMRLWVTQNESKNGIDLG